MYFFPGVCLDYFSCHIYHGILLDWIESDSFLWNLIGILYTYVCGVLLCSALMYSTLLYPTLLYMTLLFQPSSVQQPILPRRVPRYSPKPTSLSMQSTKVPAALYRLSFFPTLSL